MKLLSKITLSVLVVLSSPLFASDIDFPAPFGLSWGMSSNEIKKLGFSKYSEIDGIDKYVSKTVPKPWSDGRFYIAEIYKGRLVRLTSQSAEIIGDSYGVMGKEKYSNIRGILSKKYGKPTYTSDLKEEKLSGGNQDKFYQCIMQGGCGRHYSFYNVNNGNILIELKGVKPGTGVIQVAYVHPRYRAAQDSIKQKNQKIDVKAF